MVFIGILALVLAVVLVRFPWWVNASLLGLSLLFSAGLTELERVTLPAITYGLAVGLLVPIATQLQRNRRVAPSRKRRAPVAAHAPGQVKQGNGSFDSIDIPGYEILEKVGSGGMASVYRAKNRKDGRIVALKIPMEQYVADAKFIRRFHREAEVAQQLDHTNIVRTFEHGSLGIKHYMVMEFVDGRSLESYVEGEGLDIDVSVEVMKLVTKALQHIHSAGIIHRDIKPANIMIVRDGIGKVDGKVALNHDAVKLMDFGIAGGKVLSRLTMTGARIGTPVYMSPEQARGLKIDHRSDIYSLGLVFYEMLTGQTAFKGGYEAIVHQQIFQMPPPPRQLKLEIPKALDGLVMRMIAKEPDERPDLDEVLEFISEGIPDDAPSTDLPSRILLTVSTRQGVLRVLDPEGSLHSSLGDIGVGDGQFSAAPLSVGVDSAANFYAAVFEYRVGQEQHEMIHKLDAEGRPLFTFGAYGMKPGEFLYPASLSVAPDDTVCILDSETHLVQRFSSDGQYLSHFGGRGEGKGSFNDPRMIIVARDGSIYVLDYGNRQVQRFDAQGTYQTRWAFRQSADKAEMRPLDGFTVDQDGNLYVSDALGGKIRKISEEGKITQSYALQTLQGEATDALLDLGVDDRGYLYAARRGGHFIRKYDGEGMLVEKIETYAPIVQMTIDIKKAAPVLNLNPSLLLD